MSHAHRLLRFNAAARVALLVQGSTTAARGWWSPISLLADGGAIGQAMLMAMSALVCIGWADVLVNDVLPDRVHLAAVRRREHVGYLMLGAVFWVQAMGITSSTELPGAGVLLAEHLLVGAVCCWYGWISAMRGGRHG